MNEETSKLLQQLASKLGTTTEYLWGVLLKQAPISAFTDLIYLVIFIIAGIAIYKWHKRNLVVYNEDDYKGNRYYHNDVLGVFVCIVAFFWVVGALIVFFNLHDTVSAIFNPEYWALNEILSQLK